MSNSQEGIGILKANDASIVGDGSIPFYTIYARSFNYTSNIQVIISPQGSTSLERLRNMLEGSYVSLVHKTIQERIVEIYKIELNPTFLKLDDIIQIWFQNPIYKTSLYVKYYIVTSEGVFEGMYEVLLLNDNEAKSNAQPIDNKNRVLDIQLTPEKEYVVKPFEPVLLMHLNFGSYTPVEFGTGTVTYSGGGNRFIQNKDQILVVQEEDQDPMFNRFSAYSEIETENLIENDFLNGIPDEYEIVSDNLTISSDTFEHDAIQGAKGLQVIVHDSAIINGILKINMPSTVIDILKPLAFSSYLGIQSYSSSQLNKVNINFVFYNETTEIGTITKEITPTTVMDTMIIVSGIVNVEDIPATTTKVKIQIELIGLDRGERFIVQMILPQLIQSLINTTPILNKNQRKGDIYSIPQLNNFNINSGSIELTYIPGTNDNILTSILFDSTLLGLNGIRIVLHSNQTLEFIINDGTINQSIISPAIILTEQDTAIIRINWSNLYRRIFFNNNQLIENTSSFTLPSVSNTSLFIGCSSQGLEQINGKLISLKIYG